jgi:hypothetical protein
MRRTLPYVLLAALLPANAAAEVRLAIGTVEADPGDRISVAVQVIATAGENVATIANELEFDPEVMRVPTNENGDADCTVAADVPHFFSAFLRRPPECESGEVVCSGIRAAIVLLTLDRPPVTPRTLYRCTLEIDAGASPGTYPLRLSAGTYSGANGPDRPVTPIDGAVIVASGPARTQTPTATPPGTAKPTAGVLAPGCTGDCDASESVDAEEEGTLLHAVFDPHQLEDCVGSDDASEPAVKASHLIAAARARWQGCEGLEPVATPTITHAVISSRTVTRTPTAIEPEHTATPTLSMPPEEDTATPTLRPSRSPTRTRTPTRTRRPSATLTRTRVRSPSPTPTPTRMIPTPTGTPEIGPVVSYIGVARADGRLMPVVERLQGVPVYELVTGAGFYLVVEGAPSDSGAPVGRVTSSAFGSPDFQGLFDRNLGDGSDKVCSGGVPGFEPVVFDDSEVVVDAFNDLGCRFTPSFCVAFPGEIRTYVAPESTVQFCAIVSSPIRFGRGETTMHVRLRDRDGRVGEVARAILRVL